MRYLKPMAIAGAILLLLSTGTCPANEPLMDPRLVEAERIYRSEGPSEALPEFSRLLKTFETESDDRNIALAHGYIGACHWRLGNYDQARQHLDISLAIKQEIGDRLQEGKTLNVLGLLDWDLGNFDQAIENFGLASQIGKETGDHKLQGASLNNLSLVYDELGDYQTSLTQYQQVLAIYDGIDFPRGKGDTLGNIGGVYLLLGQFSKAEFYYLQALQISEQLESVSSKSQDHGNLGLAYTGMGKTDLALQHFDQALELAEQAGMRKEQGQWLRGKANTQLMMGHYALGLESHSAAINTLESAGAEVQLLDALHDMGELQLMLGDPVSAQQYFQRTLELANRLDMPRLVTMNMLALGDIQYGHQRLNAASTLYEQALIRAVEAGEANHHSRALLRLARVYRDRGNIDQGRIAAQTALDIARETGARAIETEALFMLAELDREAGDIEGALKRYRQADELSKELGDPDLQWQVDFGHAMALERSGQIEAAISALQAAANEIESVRNRLREKRYRSGYLHNKSQVFTELVRLQMQLSRTSDAFSTSERLRAWTYVEQTEFSVDQSLNENQQRSRTELRERIQQLQRNLEDEKSQVNPGTRQLAIDTFSSELLLAEREFQALMDDISGGAAGGLMALRQSSETEIQHQLNEDEALIEYVVGESNVTIFVLTSDTLHAITTPVDRMNLHSRLELLRGLLRQRENDRWKMPAQSLAQTLLQPIQQSGWIKNINHLYLVPHGMLNYLPFALLPIDQHSEQHSVIERFTLAYLPAASSLVYGATTDREPRSLLAMVPAASRLKYAPEEVRSIGALFGPGAELLLGEKATESTFKNNAGNFKILHLATHGYFNKFNPLLSGLQLEADTENDGLLEVHEILNLKLNSELVTLSACKTGLGSGYFSAIPAGDDFVGMTRAFLQAGSVSVLATLWEVEDRSTVDLMKSFYGNLSSMEPGRVKAGALARAQRQLKTSQTYEHPYYWASFILVGSMSQNRNAQS